MKFKFEINFILILVASFTLVILTGWFVNQKISTAVDKVNIRLRPDERIILMKDVNKDLMAAENKIYSYNLTKKRSHLASFYRITTQTEKKIRKLRNYSRKDTYFITQIDSLEKMVLLKYDIMYRLLRLQNDYRVNEAMGKVIERINHENYKNNVVAENESETKGSKKWFSIFNKKGKEDSGSPTVIENQFELNQFKKDINRIRKEEGKKEIINNKIELQLIQEDRLIMSQISSFLTQMEMNERKNIADKATLAKIAVMDAKLTIQIFSLVATLLLVITSFVIIRYIRKNNEYNQFLEKARIDSEELANSKVRFISNLSHEIRTPLNSIIGFSEQLSQKNLELPGDDRQQLTIIQKSAQHLSSIINNILDFSKLESNKMLLEQIDFRPEEEITEVIDLLQFGAREKNNRIALQIDTDVPPFLSGDSVKLRQILLNLLGNSIKFTENDVIQINVKTCRFEDKKVYLKIEVIDHGIGIEKSQLDSIFDEFEQESTTIVRKYGGTGLGLSITKMLVELQKGTIFVDSEKGKETKFTVCIPYELGKKKETVTVDDNFADLLKGKSVLIADDESYNRKLLISILNKYEVFVTEAENGEQALKHTEEKIFDIILMDMRMPLMNGIETTEKIRRSKNNPNRNGFIIALTAGSADEFGDISAFDSVMGKPFQERELLNLLTSIPLANRGQEENTHAGNEETSDKPFDLHSLKELSGDNHDFFKEMIETFIQTTEQGLNKMREEFQNENWKQVSEIAHKISSPCKHLSAINLYHLLKKIEYSKDSEQKSELADLIYSAENEAKFIIQAIKEENL